jgi:hypothetical protein
VPQVGQAPIRSAEDLRTLYRALGMSEETLTRAIQFTETEAAPATPTLRKGRRRPVAPPSKSKSRPSRGYGAEEPVEA